MGDCEEKIQKNEMGDSGVSRRLFGTTKNQQRRYPAIALWQQIVKKTQRDGRICRTQMEMVGLHGIMEKIQCKISLGG